MLGAISEQIKNANSRQFQNSDSLSPIPDKTELRHSTDDSTLCMSGVIVRVKNVETLITRWNGCPPGSLAYTEDEEAMLVRVGSGWQYVLVRERNGMHNRAKILLHFYCLQLGTLVTSQEDDNVIGSDLSEDAE